MRAIEQRSEHMRNPLGIDNKKPVLTWQCSEGKAQTAYRVLCHTEEEMLFDTGKVSSSEMMCEYGGRAVSRERIFWQVQLWDENDIAGELSDPSWFEFALLNREFEAEWIDPEEHDNTDANAFLPAAYLKNTFSVGEPFRKARIYATAHGVYSVYINGIHVKENLLTPGTSEYWFRLPYQTFDVTSYVREGENEIQVILGDGWWRGSNGNTGTRNVFGRDIALLLQLEIDGKTILKTDKSWKASSNGPIIFNDLQLGEKVDARKKITDWHDIRVRDFGYSNLLCSNSVPIVEKEAFRAVLLRTPNGEKVLDFGQNLAGWISFDLIAREGQKIRLTLGEYLDEKGNFSDKNFETIGRKNQLHQVVEYICEEGRNTYCSQFCISGYRFALLETDIPVSGDEFVSHAVYSDLEETADFHCDHELVNQLFRNAVWSTKSNFVDIPTDCPQRERSGWTGDAALYAYTGLRIMDTYPVFRKWLGEERVVQHEDGRVRNFAPRRSPKLSLLDGIYDGSTAWGDCSVIVPYEMYRLYGDKSILVENYSFMKKWLSYCEKKAKRFRLKNLFNPYKKLIIDTGIHYGEWLEAGISMADGMKKIILEGIPEVATAYFAYSCRLMSEIADILEETNDAAYYKDLEKKLTEAYRYIELKDGSIKGDRQCRFVRPLAMHLLSGEQEKQTAERLNALVVENGYHLNTGFLTTPELCRVLADHGYVETAYKVLLQEDTPGWLFAVKSGSTTIWESWEGHYGDAGVSSLNHYSKGAVVSWLIDGICGIHVEQRKIRIRPQPFPLMQGAKATLHSPTGTIVSAWQYTEENKLVFNIAVPANTEATFIYPNGKEQELSIGDNTLHYNLIDSSDV